MVSHSLFLLRSPRTKTQLENIDVIFQNTDYIECPTILHGIELSPTADLMQLATVTARRGITFSSGERLFLLTSAGKVFHLAAHAVTIHTNTLDIFASPLHAILGVPEAAAHAYADKITTRYVLR